VDPSTSNNTWHLIDSSLDNKTAITVFRVIRSVPSLHAHDGQLTLIKLKPKTGHYHQLRRHMAWICQRPLVGDDEYDGGTIAAMRFRQQQGLFLCATQVLLEHPFYNSVIEGGRVAWEKQKQLRKNKNKGMDIDDTAMAQPHDDTHKNGVASKPPPSLPHVSMHRMVVSRCGRPF